MARKPRFHLPGVPQHVIQRGNNREPCFYAEQDYQRYLRDLHEALRDNDCRLHAYVLMTNHVHLLVTPMSEHGVSHLMQDIGRTYVRYINHCYRRTGTLWEGRYKSSVIDSRNKGSEPFTPPPRPVRLLSVIPKRTALCPANPAFIYQTYPCT